HPGVPVDARTDGDIDLLRSDDDALRARKAAAGGRGGVGLVSWECGEGFDRQGGARITPEGSDAPEARRPTVASLRGARGREGQTRREQVVDLYAVDR